MAAARIATTTSPGPAIGSGISARVTVRSPGNSTPRKGFLLGSTEEQHECVVARRLLRDRHGVMPNEGGASVSISGVPAGRDAQCHTERSVGISAPCDDVPDGRHASLSYRRWMHLGA